MFRIRLLAAVLACAAAHASHAADAAAPAVALPPPVPYGAPISLADARVCIAAAAAEASRNQWFMVVTVVDSGGHTVVTERMDNTQFGSLTPALQKAQSAVSFRRSTKFFEDMIAQGGASIRIMRLDEILPIEGGLPLIRDGKLIGGVGVSGGSAQQDGVAAAACVKALAP